MPLENFQIATAADAEFLVELVNAAYRPESDTTGWTHEAALITGARINISQLTEIMAQSNISIVMACYQQQQVACVQIENKEQHSAYLGMLAVKPALQMAGFGKQMLTYAEHYARTQLGAQKFVMYVLAARTELIAFYLRRGYQQTGKFSAYPLSAGCGIPKQSDLKIEILEKLA